MTSHDIVHWIEHQPRRWSLYLACIPVVVFAVAFALASPKAKKVTPPTYVEQVAPKADFVQRFGAPQEPAVRVVKTVPITRAAVDVAPPPPPVGQIAADQPVPTERELRRPRVRVLRHSRGDICARHNMRKEITRGGKSWRCRR